MKKLLYAIALLPILAIAAFSAYSNMGWNYYEKPGEKPITTSYSITTSSSVVMVGNGRIVWANGQVSTAPVTSSGATWGVIGGTIGDQTDLAGLFTGVGTATATIAGKIVTSHAGLSSTGTLTHASLESTLTAVNAATTTLKSISDAHAATLLQVGVDTATLAGMVGGGDYLTTSSATATYGRLASPNVWTDTQKIGQVEINTPLYGLSDNAHIWLNGKGSVGDYGAIYFSSSNPLGETSSRILGKDSVMFLDAGYTSILLGAEYGRYIDITGGITSDKYIRTVGSITANGGFYGSVANCTGFPAATVPASISVDTITVGGTPALDGYPVSVNGDVLVSSGVLYLRNSQLLLAHPDGETSVYLLSTDSDSYNADILMQSGSTLTVTGSGGNKSHYVQNGNITCDYIQGDGSTLTGVIDADCRASTGTILSMFTSVGDSTATLRTDYTALAQSTGAFTTVGTATATLRTDMTAVKQSTAVTITSNWITLGATQTYVTTLSTRIASGIQIQPFTISSATARVNGGTSATLRLFITDKNTEFNISAATPIWNTGVVAGTAHTGGTMSNTAVAANQSITAVIDGISGAVADIVLWVRGTR